MLNSASQLRVELPSAVLGANGIELGYVVGGGGGHALRINNATLQTTAGLGAAEAQRPPTMPPDNGVLTRLEAAGFPRDQVLQALLNTQGIDSVFEK